MTVDRETFRTNGANYLGALDATPEASAATDEFFAILSESCAAPGLILAQELGHPALCGIVGDLEAGPAAAHLLSLPVQETARWRQAVGVGIKFAMAELGWATTGTKGAVINSEHFTRAERYARPA